MGSYFSGARMGGGGGKLFISFYILGRKKHTNKQQKADIVMFVTPSYAR